MDKKAKPLGYSSGKATVFEFISYKFEPENKRIFFSYKQNFKGKDSINYTETIVFPEVPNLKSLPEGLMDKLLQGLHLILGVSYWKLYCATKIKFPYSLTKKESDFWNIVYRNGFGEFFYRNKLNPKISAKFNFDKKAKVNNFNFPKTGKYLVAVSGGKDSIVAAELLKEKGIDIAAIFTETQKKSEFVDQLAGQIGINFLKIQRFLDSQVFQKHDYDGHIPISAVYAFLGTLFAVLYGYSGFIVANEYSSNFGNVKYKGKVINHQWSKSSEFEVLFQNYLRSFITPDLDYFSIVRHFYEIRIAKLFSKYNKYFPYFSSCNRNFKITVDESRGKLWCGECPKCAFVFLIMSVFLEKENLLNIFNKDLFSDEKLLPLFKDILGFGNVKPFDCVGAFEESRVALYLARDKFADSLVVKEFLPRIKNPEKLVNKVFKAQKSNAPDCLKFLGLETAGILGYGKEGKATEEYLKNNFPNLKLGILDKSIDKDYLKKQDQFDILIKTPGIPASRVKIPYTTATNIFFSEIKAKGNKIVGVTGSKGKSTTASLIYHILKQSGKDVELLGNMGLPMLKALSANIKKDKIFVLELSSAQLEDINYSPNISVVTNLFPEHMDYHGSKENYFFAKQNIIKFQGGRDTFIYNGQNKLARIWAKNSKAEAIDFSEIKLPASIKPKILGEHNLSNIKAALLVSKFFNIKDNDAISAINSFNGLPHRLEFIGQFKDIKFYDDAISTTPESTIMALRALKDVDTIFLGGQDRGYDFSQLENNLKKYKIRNIVFFPNSGEKILKSFNKKFIKNLNILKTNNMKEAVDFAYKNTKPGRICLLSCASPSYSVWKNFEEKGDEFKKFVNEKAF